MRYFSNLFEFGSHVSLYYQSITFTALKIAFRWLLFNIGDTLISEIMKNRFYGLADFESDEYQLDVFILTKTFMLNIY